MNDNINTRGYWDDRFRSGGWESGNGRWQTEHFAKGLVGKLDIDSDFEGTLLDFGCGLGDGMPIYKRHFPKARLIGMDISQSAIDNCNLKYGSIATFIRGEYTEVPEVDVITSSNVFEHLSDYRIIASHLLSRCKSLNIMVPYAEQHRCAEHVNCLDEEAFAGVGSYVFLVFPCHGWSEFGQRLWLNVHLKNILRFLGGKPVRKRSLQILFKFANGSSLP